MGKHPPRWFGPAFGAAALGLASVAAAAQEVTPAYDPDQKIVRAVRAPSVPVIDGRVDEAAWAAAVPVSDFRQREPIEGGSPSERTEAWVLYDEEYLYVAFICFASDPQTIIATELRRDQRMNTDDTIAVILDTFHDHRNAFVFRVNPLGTKYDMTLQDESRINSQWDETWEAAAQITERGWEAEMAIPLRILRYRSGTHIWGVDFKREIRHTNEISQWSNYRRSFSVSAISQSGHLQGLEGLGLGKRFRLKPFVSASYTELERRDVAEEIGDADAGIDDFKIQLSSYLTADLTVNPDFAQVEVDAQRVNLTRFPLFFPEKRDFFLESADNFSFGTRPRFGQAPLALLYFSRRVGLSERGEPIPIAFGGKVTGRIGGGNLGFLNVQTRDSAAGPGQNYTALRWRQDVFARSTVGAIVTNVRSRDGAYNRVAGLDGNFTFLESLGISGFVAAAQDEGIDGNAWTGELNGGWNSDTWDASFGYLRVDPDFRTDLGFVLRTDIVHRNLLLAWKPRPGISRLRQLVFTGAVEVFDDTSGRLVTRNQRLSASLRMESGDFLTFQAERVFERLDEPFPIHPDVTIPPGEYSFDGWDVTYRAFAGRRMSGSARVAGGEFYDGKRLVLGAGPQVRVTEKLSFGFDYNFNAVDLPGGEFTTHVVNSEVNVSFTDRWLTTALVQYNSVADQISLFARLDFIYRTGDDLFVVYKQARALGGPFAQMDDRSLSTKLTYSFEF